MLAQQLLHAREPFVVDDAGQPLVAGAIGDTFRTALGHIDLIADALG